MVYKIIMYLLLLYIFFNYNLLYIDKFGWVFFMYILVYLWLIRDDKYGSVYFIK